MSTFFCFCLIAGIAVSGGVLESRIIGGDFAKQSKFAFVASLRTNSNKFLCGGAIVHKYWVLTAAECVQKQSTNNLTVVVGTPDLNSGGVNHQVSLIRIHPNYVPNTKENNIALVKVSSKIAENKNVEKIDMAKTVISDDKDVEVAGWGAMQKDSPQNFTNSLHWVELKTYSFTNCKRSLPQIYYYNICTKGKASKGVCNGDVGSPLFRRGGIFSSDELHGIVSQYANCANGLPDVYVSVAAFKLWIDQEIGK
ncbi:hypothetical protein RN001_010381 [Aquatica leii]|uniref:Peptidase S1 domain-containing protein n=1 Tax=Aquatica leii TaxID=1421715 RepID=A0AAN7SQA6_9COLE|nr:hypothetical protein RN001_010381 [Aquatica leii]